MSEAPPGRMWGPDREADVEIRQRVAERQVRRARRERGEIVARLALSIDDLFVGRTRIMMREEHVLYIFSHRDVETDGSCRMAPVHFFNSFHHIFGLSMIEPVCVLF